MKKSSFIKIAKVTGLVSGVLFLSLIVWANWEAKGYTQTHVADSQFVVYDVSEFKNDNQQINLEKAISSIEDWNGYFEDVKAQLIEEIDYLKVDMPDGPVDDDIPF